MQFGDTGTYKLTVSLNGCTSPEGAVQVHANPTPFVVIVPSPGDSICNGEPVVFTAYGNNHGGAPTYQWFVNGTPTGTGTLFNSSALNNGDIVRCDMTENTKCSVPVTDQSNDIEMKVLPWLAPAVTISANPTPPWNDNVLISFTATPTNGGNNPGYQWKRNGANVQGATNAVWGVNANQLSENDKICVLLTSKYRCPQPDTASSGCINTQFTGVGDVDNDKNIKVYPNPTKNAITISSAKTIEKVELSNLLGQKLILREGNATTMTISLEGFAPGMYIIKVNDSYVERVVKE